MMEEIEIDQLKDEPQDIKLQKLQKLKNLLIGSQEYKEIYFNRGLIETLFSMVGKEQNDKVLQEIITLINCYFFDFPQAIDCMKMYNTTFIQMHFFLSTYKDGSPQLIDIVLRILRNALLHDIVKAKEFENQNVIKELAPLMTTKSRVMIIAKIVSILCQNNNIRAEISGEQACLDILLKYVTENQLKISEECFLNCLAALAEITTNNKANCLLIYDNHKILEVLSRNLRHSENLVKIKTARIFTNLNKYYKLPREYQAQFKWVMMQMAQLIPLLGDDERPVSEILRIIRRISKNTKDRKFLQKVASDIMIIEKLCDIIVSGRTLSAFDFDEQFDVEMDGSQDDPAIRQKCTVLRTLAALTSDQETCRKKIAENKNFLVELLSILKSTSKEAKYTACKLFVSLTRSDKMIKSIILEAGEFTKELQKIFLESDNDARLQLTSCKALCNLAIDFQKNFSSETAFLKKLIIIAKSDNQDLKVAACFTLKNLLYRCSRDVKLIVTKELTSDVLLKLLEDSNLKVQEQGLMIYRNLLYHKDDIQQTLNDGGDTLINQIELNLDSKQPTIVTQTLYVLSSIANGNQKQRKLIFEDRFFNRCLQLLKSTDNSSIKIGVVNYIINLAYKETDNKIKEKLNDIKVSDLLVSLKENEKDVEVRGFIDRALIHLNK
eukprot:403356120